MTRFQICLPLVLVSEAGYVDHPDDPGGATNLGMTQAALAAWRGRPVSKAEVRALTVADVAPIYETQYWRAAACDRLPAGVDYMVFDMAVNSGVVRAAKYLQLAVGVEADGHIGPVTLAALARKAPAEVVRTMAGERLAYYRGLANFPIFGKGWLRRLARVRRDALGMVR